MRISGSGGEIARTTRSTAAAIREGEHARPVARTQLGDEGGVRAAGGHALETELVRKLLDQLERAPADGPGGAEAR